MTKTELVQALEEFLGTDQIIAREEELLVYECDGMTIEQARPGLVVLPTTTAQVAAVARLLHQHRIPFVPRGAGTGLSGGAITAGGVIISLTRMNRILEVDLKNGRAVVQPGVVNLGLSNAVKDQGYYFAPDPSSQQACTIGGNVAENSGGPHCLKYGVTTNHVLGLELVLPDGEIVRLGGKIEDRPGYDLTGLVVGSEGTFGIVTEITVKLMRLPQAYKTLLAVFDTVADATNTISQTIAAGILPAALEMMDNVIIQAVEEAFHFGFPLDAEAVLIIELDGLAAALDRQMERIIPICQENNVREVQVSRDAQERDQLWTSRKRAFGAIGRLRPSYYTQDGVVPRTRLPEILRFIGEVSRRYNLPIANVFHGGDGNLHPVILFDERKKDQIQKVIQASEEILKACVEVGGSITGEHGIGLEKRNYMPWIFSPEDLQLMGKIKTAFNPDNICNPGKILPTAKAGKKE